MHRLLKSALFLALLSGVAAPAHALPPASLSFIDRVGTTNGTDPVEVWVRLTVDPAATEPLSLDTAFPAQGFDEDDLPADFVVDSIFLNVSFTCSGTFTASCTDPPPYRFSFHTGTGDPSRPSFSGLPSILLEPGESRDFLYGFFTPEPGPVPAGTYLFYNAAFFVAVSGTGSELRDVLDGNLQPVLDANGDPVQELYTGPLELTVPIASTCPNDNSACAFTRTVPIPEPGTYALFALGLAALAAVRRQRPRRRYFREGI